MSFLPTDLTGCVCWLKRGTGLFSDAGTTPVADAGTIAQWNDQSGNSNHATQTTSGNRLTWSAQSGFVESVAFGAINLYFNIPTLNLDNQSMSAFFILGDFVTLYEGDVNHTLMSSAAGTAFNFGFAGVAGPLTDTTFRKLRIYNGALHYGSTWVPNGPSLCGIAAGASSCKLIVNNTIDSLSALTAGATTGQTVCGQAPNPRSETFWGGMREIFIYNRQLSDGEIAQVQSYAAALNAVSADIAPNVLAIAGDSLSAGYKEALNKTYMRQMRPKMPRCLEYNPAKSGLKITDWQTMAATYLDPYVTSGKRNVLFVALGLNDNLAGDSGATMYANMVSLATAARSAGWDKICVATNTPASNRSNVVRAAFNSAVLADTTHWDAVADWGGSSVMGQDGQNTDLTYYNADATHWTATGAGVMALIAASALAPLMLDYGFVR